MDLISRQAAIQEIKDLPDCPNGYSDTYDKAQIIGVLEKLPSAHPEQRWIPCSEGLPQKTDFYLVTVKDWNIPQQTDFFNSHKKWDTFGDRVIAWQPLPEPYKEDEEYG